MKKLDLVNPEVLLQNGCLTVRAKRAPWVMACLALLCSSLAAQQIKEVPLGLVVESNGGLHFRAGAGGSLAAKPGIVLFSGDSLRASGSTVRVLSCAENRSILLSPDADVLFEAKGLKFRTGRVLETQGGECGLPPLPRHIDPVRQHADLPAGTDQESLAAGMAALAAPERAAVQGELAASGREIAAHPGETLLRVRRAALLARYGLTSAAAGELRKVVADWPDAAWALSWLHELAWTSRERGVRSLPAVDEAGRTHAVLVGISDFQSEDIPKLRFAHKDAISFRELLASPRAGAVASEDVVLLANQQATHQAIQEAIEKALKIRSNPKDTVIVLLASHGVVFENEKEAKGYILAYDTNPADPATTAISMDYIRELFATAIKRGTRLLLYVDVCHAGKIGQIVSPVGRTNSYAEATLQAPERFFGLLAAQGRQVALEGEQFGGGHGAFSYFLLDALNGGADRNGDGRITMNELSRHVLNNVEDGTDQQQTPKQIGEIDAGFVMSTTDKPGIAMLPFRQRVLLASRDAAPADRGMDTVRFGGSDGTLPDDVRALIVRLDQAIREGRLLGGNGENAMGLVQQLEPRLSAARFENESTKVRIALEDRGEQVLLQYLKGEQAPQRREDFLAGEAYFRAASQLTRDSLLLESRALFCRGRALVFDKEYRTAKDLIERSIRLDPDRAYSYNALGIAYLEQADYGPAIAAFRDAARRAPFWAYPLHNLALAQSESGDYRAAILAYQQAMRLAPGHFYLPYNLGLLYQRMNRRRDAEASYRKAMDLAPAKGEAYNALGSLRAEQGRWAQAEELYRTALKQDPELLAARHNLASLLSREPARMAEAVALWQENLRKSPDHLPSRVSLARALARNGRAPEATEAYRVLLAQRPDYLAARLALAELYAQSGDRRAAVRELEAAARQSETADVYERIGDLEQAQGRTEEARKAWTKALATPHNRSDAKRLRRKLKP